MRWKPKEINKKTEKGERERGSWHFEGGKMRGKLKKINKKKKEEKGEKGGQAARLLILLFSKLANHSLLVLSKCLIGLGQNLLKLDES